MKHEDQVNLLLLLIQNLNVFAWSPYEVPGVDLEFITHKINVDPLYPSKKQKPTRLAKQHLKAVKRRLES